jgi:hypothetical protein
VRPLMSSKQLHAKTEANQHVRTLQLTRMYEAVTALNLLRRGWPHLLVT